jgi:hypothetical protein
MMANPIMIITAMFHELSFFESQPWILSVTMSNNLMDVPLTPRSSFKMSQGFAVPWSIKQ